MAVDVWKALRVHLAIVHSARGLDMESGVIFPEPARCRRFRTWLDRSYGKCLQPSIGRARAISCNLVQGQFSRCE